MQSEWKVCPQGSSLVMFSGVISSKQMQHSSLHGDEERSDREEKKKVKSYKLKNYTFVLGGSCSNVRGSRVIIN